MDPHGQIINFQEAAMVYIYTCDARRFRAKTKSAKYGSGWGRGNYAHLCRNGPEFAYT